MANRIRHERVRPAAERPAARAHSAEHSTFEWNGAAGVREMREAESDDARQGEVPRNNCVGEICEPMS